MRLKEASRTRCAHAPRDTLTPRRRMAQTERPTFLSKWACQTARSAPRSRDGSFTTMRQARDRVTTTTETHLLITVGIKWAIEPCGPMPGCAINIDLLRDRMNSTPRYAEALTWAEALHRNQHRNGKKVPFLSHVISVSALVWEDGGNEDQAIAGLLHDASRMPVRPMRPSRSASAGRWPTS